MGAVQGGCGELRGLTWADVDFEEGQVSVRRTLEESSAGLTFKEPKTARGARTLALPAITVEALREHRKAQPAARVLDVEPVALAQLGQLVEGRCPAVGVAAVAVHHGAAPVAGARPEFVPADGVGAGRRRHRVVGRQADVLDGGVEADLGDDQSHGSGVGALRGSHHLGPTGGSPAGQRALRGASRRAGRGCLPAPVSYTHLTLPTNREV